MCTSLFTFNSGLEAMIELDLIVWRELIKIEHSRRLPVWWLETIKCATAEIDASRVTSSRTLAGRRVDPRFN